MSDLPPAVGFEPATLWLRDPCATPLGYTRHSLQVVPKIPSGTKNKKIPQYVPICFNMSQYAPIYPIISKYIQIYLFVTTRVATRDGNFLIGAPFVSDRPRHLFFRPKRSVLGPADVFGPFSTVFAFFSVFFFGGTAQIQERKKCSASAAGW